MSDIANLDNPTRKCTGCAKDAVAKCVKFHKSPSAGDTTKKRRKYADETGRLWHGTKCPDCAAKWRKERSLSQAEQLQAEIKAKLES